MSINYVIAVDGSESSLRAAQYAKTKAELADANLSIIHVLEWSPYSFLTNDELEQRRKRRREELDRATNAIIAPVVKDLGVANIKTEVRFGQISKCIFDFCNEIKADQLFIGRHGGSGLSSRLFGSVPSTLVQISKVPVTVIP